jgi:transposase
VVDVVRELLVGDHDEDVLAVVEQLVSRNTELELLLAKVREHAKNKSERVSREQLDLFLHKLKAAQQGALAKASEKLEETAAAQGGREEIAKPVKQPPVRRPPPPGLRRVDNEIAVPAPERPCPRCGGARTCIGLDTTEVIELTPRDGDARGRHEPSRARPRPPQWHRYRVSLGLRGRRDERALPLYASAAPSA